MMTLAIGFFYRLRIWCDFVSWWRVQLPKNSWYLVAQGHDHH